MKTTIVSSTVFLLTACATNGVADYRSTGINEKVVVEPTSSNSYRGVLVEKPPASDGALDARALEICSTRGGLKTGPSYSHTVPLGWKFHNYQCNGPSLMAAPQATPQYVDQQSTRPAPTVSNATSIKEAKSKCADLGFKDKSEGFGKCVLRLSK